MTCECVCVRVRKRKRERDSATKHAGSKSKQLLLQPTDLPFNDLVGGKGNGLSTVIGGIKRGAIYKRAMIMTRAARTDRGMMNAGTGLEHLVL